MSRSPVALTATPLSREFRERLHEELGDEVDYVNLAELRRLPPLQAIARLRHLRGADCMLPLESADGTPILPILEAVAAVARASSLRVVSADLEQTIVPRRRILRSLATLGRASIDGRRALRQSRRELSRLLSAPLQQVALGPGNRLLYVNGNLWLGLKAGGSIGHVAGVVNGLHDVGLDVTLATVVEPVGVRQEVQVERLAPPGVFALPLELNHHRLQHSMARQVGGLNTARLYAFVYQRLSVANYVGAAVSRSWRVPLVLEYNGSEVWVARNWGRALRYEHEASMAEEAMLRHAHLVVTISEALREELVERGVARERIVWYPNCVDAELFDPGRITAHDRESLRKRYGIAKDAVVVGFIGTFGQWHGVEVLARVISHFVRDASRWLEEHGVHFLLVGDGLRMDTVRTELAWADTERFVTLTGLVPQAEAPIHLAAADVLVSPHVPNADGSPFFGSPTKLFEYMAMEKPIIASNLDQIGEILRPSLETAQLPFERPPAGDGHLAVLTEPGSVEELAAAIRFAVEQPAWRSILGRNARARALERYTWRHHVGAILSQVDALRGAG